jgi:hypothetical protein
MKFKRIFHLLFILSVVVLIGCTSTSTGGRHSSNNGDDGNDDGDNPGQEQEEEEGGGNITGEETTSAIIADADVIADYAGIPASAIDQAITNFHIYYGHTSHGSQLVTGMEMLQGSSHDWAGIDIEEESSDLGHNGDLTWADTTRNRLDEAGSDINVVIWSWCGGVSDNTAEGIDAYLGEMNSLEGDYPDVTFVYMTGHTDGTGASGTLRQMNARIRDYVEEHKKILYDFESVESYDPDGNYYVNTSDDCGWCTDWCAAHTCEACSDCAHSHCFNCYQKGKAFWWLLARIAGWDGN